MYQPIWAGTGWYRPVQAGMSGTDRYKIQNETRVYQFD